MSNWKQKPTMECPACKEIEFKHVDTLVGKHNTTLEYKCICGEVGFFDEPLKKVETIGVAYARPEKYPGVAKFVADFGREELYAMGKTDLINICFLAGRCYEAEKDLEATKAMKIGE